MPNTSNLGITKHPTNWIAQHPGQGPEEMVNAALDNIDAALVTESTEAARALAAEALLAPSASPNFSGNITLSGTHGETCVRGQSTELITLSTVGLTTDSVANLLPATSVIEAVVARVITTITTATNWALGDATVANRFAVANATLVAGTTSVGTKHFDAAGTSGPIQTAAAKLRITCTGSNPGAGVIRVTVFYRTFVPPTS